MKAKPKTPNNFEDFAYSNGCNPEDFDGLSIIRVMPKYYKSRMKYSEIYNSFDEWYDDLYDDQIEYETRRAYIQFKKDYQEEIRAQK